MLPKLKKRFHLMAMGGTFDHFHIGHESFLKYADSFSEKLLIGVMADKFVQGKASAKSIQPYKIRVKHVLNFCRQNNINCEIVELTDPYGPTIDKDFKGIDSLCATTETEKGADKINEIRGAMNMRPLPIYLAPLLNDETNTPLHSTKIRAGQVNRNGEFFAGGFPEGVTINAKQRQFFSKPLGPIVSVANHSPKDLVAVVGDYALSQFLLRDWTYQVGVYDGKTQREPFVHELLSKIHPTLEISNPAGAISGEVFEKLSDLNFENKNHILVDGEEDLITAALILTLPLSSILYYGQPNKGMVKLSINEELKEKVWQILKK